MNKKTWMLTVWPINYKRYNLTQLMMEGEFEWQCSGWQSLPIGEVPLWSRSFESKELAIDAAKKHYGQCFESCSNMHSHEWGAL